MTGTTGTLDRLRGRLVVSCQAPPGDPLHGPDHMAAMARAAAAGGAAGIRANGLADVRAVRSAVDVPLIGLWKDGTSGVYITPTARHAVAVADAGADIVAIDATARPRPDGSRFTGAVEAAHAEGALVMADIATLDEGLAAESAGADLVSTALSGYTGPGEPPPGPDLALVAALADRLTVPVVAEGRVHTPDEAARALDSGAWSVVVGTAITAPGWITSRYVRAMAR